MAGTSDKARFYLEQSLPELKEYERKKIFSSDEISSIARKRSDFEHKINARGCQPTDYARYAEYEINLDCLRRKRVRRLRVKAVHHTGQRRVFFILDRATRKFPGDIGLWMQQIEFARRQKAHKKLSRILTKALRLHPTKPDLWTYAAQFAMEENGDMSEARSYMQRGLRFCKGSEFLWVEYMKLELLYIAKVTARRQILGIGKDSEPQEPIRSPDGPTAAIVNLPELTAGDDSPDQAPLDDTNNTVLSKLINTPALKGAIPMAIFDAAMVQFSDDDKLAQSFFELVEGVNPVPCLREVLVHIVDHMLRAQPSSWRTAVCSIRMPCAGIPVTSAEFPSKLGISIKKLQAASTEMRNCSEYAESIRGWLETILNNDSLDVALRRVILSVLKPLRTAVT